MIATRGRLMGQLAAMVMSFFAGALLVFIQTNQSRVVGDDQKREVRDVQKSEFRKGNARHNESSTAKTTVTGASITQSPLTFGTAASSFPAVTNASITGSWTHGSTFPVTLTFTAGGGASASAQATNFLNNLIDCTAYYQDAKTSNPSRWNMVRAAINSNPALVDITFLAICPFDHNHTVHNATTGISSDGTGRIIVVSMTTIPNSATATSSSNIYLNNHGSIATQEN